MRWVLVRLRQVFGRLVNLQMGLTRLSKNAEKRRGVRAQLHTTRCEVILMFIT